MTPAGLAHAAKHGDVTGTTGDLASWLRSRRYAHTGSDVDRQLDELDPS